MHLRQLTIILILTLMASMAPRQAMAHDDFYEPRESVLAWLPVIHFVRDDMGIEPTKYSDALILALIHRESRPFGSAESHTPGTSYYGLLQMSDGYVTDATQWLGEDPFPAKKLLGKETLPLTLFFAYSERYEKRHGHRVSHVLALHKCGPGALSAARKLEREGLFFRDALKDASIETMAPGAFDYFHSVTKLFGVYAEWIYERNSAMAVSSTQYMGTYAPEWRRGEAR